MNRSIHQRLIAALCTVAIVAAGCGDRTSSPRQDAGPITYARDASAPTILDAQAGSAAIAPLGFGGAPASAQGGPRAFGGQFPVTETSSLLTIGDSQSGDTIAMNARTFNWTSAPSAFAGDATGATFARAGSFDTSATYRANSVLYIGNSSARTSSSFPLTNIGLTTEVTSPSGFSDAVALRAGGGVILKGTGTSSTGYSKQNAAVVLQVGRDFGGATAPSAGLSDLAFAYGDPGTFGGTNGSFGGYDHFISTWHYGGDDARNKMNFYLNTSNNPHGSSSPGVGNRLVMSLDGLGNMAVTGTITSGGLGIPTGSGTTNRVAKFTSTTTLGDTSFPIDDSAGTLTIGDTQASDLVTINGRTVGTSTDGVNGAFSYGLIPVATTQGSKAAIRGDYAGTVDTTAQSLTVYGVWGDASATKSAGANNLVVVGTRGFASGTADDTRGVMAQSSGTGTIAYGLHATVSGTAATSRAVFAQATGAATLNIGVDVASSGGTTNIGYRNTTGDNYFNTSGGNSGFGMSSGAAMSGKLQARSTGTSLPAIVATWGPTAGTSTGVAGVDITANGTYDTSGGTISAHGLRSIISASRSTGASNLINIAARFSASNGQTNTALQTDSGDVLLNGTSGTTSIGSTTASSEKLRVTTSPVAQTSSLDNTRVNAAGTFDTTSAGFTSRGFVVTTTSSKSAGANGLTNIAADLTATSADTNIALRTIDGSNYLNTGTGNTAIGVASGAAISSRFVVSNTSGTQGAGQFTNTPAASTANLNTLQVTSQGTYDTSGGVISNFAIFATASATRSAGASNLRNVALQATATGAQSNVAIRTNDGDINLNTVTGSTLIGYAFASAASAQLDVKATSGETTRITSTTSAATAQATGLTVFTNGTYDTTAGAIVSRGAFIQVTGTRSAGSNALTNRGLYVDASGAQVNNAIVTGNGSNYINATTGSTGVGYGESAALPGKLSVTSADATIHGISSIWAPVAGTTNNVAALRIQASGSLDATAGSLNAFGGSFTSTTTRSAGSNNVNGIALFASATGAQNNEAIRTDDGDLRLNRLSGKTSIGGTGAPTAQLTVTSTDSANHAFSSSLSITASTQNGKAAITGTTSGTVDTTAGILTSVGANGTAITTRSTGSNSLVNIGVQASASGAQENRGVYSSVTGTGDSYGGRFEVSATGTTNIGVRGNSSGAGTTNIGGSFNASGATTNIAFRTDAGDNYLNATSGNTGIGYSSGAALPGKLSVSGSSGYSVDIISSSGGTYGGVATPVARTTTLSGSARNFLQGTFDTTSGDLTAEAFRVQATSTRSAGSGLLTNKGIIVTASGGQTNIAFETVSGSNYLNTSASNTAIGYASGAALPSKLAVTSTSATSLGDFLLTPTASTFTLNTVNILANGTYDTTAGALGARGIKSFVTATRSAGAFGLTNTAAWFSASGAQTNRSLQTDDGDVALNNTSGTTGIGVSPSSGARLFVGASSIATAITAQLAPSARTSNATTITSTISGTFDTTAGALSSTSGDFSSTTTRSAGANNLTNIGLKTTASGAQVNIALQTDAGSNYLNTTSGSTGFGYASAATLPSLLSVNGNITAVGFVNRASDNITVGASPAALPAAPTVTDSWDPWGGGARTTLVRVVTDQQGSILGSLKGGTVGDIVILENHGDGSGNYGAGDLRIKFRCASCGGPPVADHIYTPDLTDIVIPYTGSIVLYYDSPTVGWIPVGLSVGGKFRQLDISELKISHPLTPSTLAAGTTNNYDPNTGGQWNVGQVESTWLRLNGDASGSTLTGLVPYGDVGPAGAAQANQGPVRIIQNLGGPITLANEDTGSTAANRFNLPNGPVVIPPGGILVLIYDQQGGGSLNQARWRALTPTGMFSKLTLYLATTDTALGATVNDYNPTGFSSRTRMRLAPSGATTTLSGLVAQEDGAVRYITAYGAGLTLSHQDTNSAAANRFYLPGGVNITLSVGQTVQLVYDATFGAWFVIGKS